MPSTKYMRSLEIDDGMLKFERTLVERKDKSGYILYLPRFIGDLGKKATVKVDIIEKKMIITLS